ncbi:oxygen-insensitive NADPH nitroreductase [Streptococcus parauberis]|uniref:oxygen-insensitive NADPH nitroreductase n=1 Tax=Streptococcus parauberis TaxID=1348 RepID=UPI000E306ACD|nr:oxygen-insensitive NADPH nitroreductase [Streptococcus parauberis]RFE01899.1 FMN reductase (NADPH) [Streptococcus parauberis]
MNQTIHTILDHVSVRNFIDQKLSEKEIEVLVEAAQAASSDSFLQAYSIMSIDDPKLLKELVKVGKLQPFILEAGHFFIFCGDFKRHHDFAKEKEIAIEETIGGVDALMVGAIDASLAAQNMTIAAESLGMGVCYIGGVRDGIEAISELLDLPDYVFPVFGLVVGYPAIKNETKPRFPADAIHHRNEYPNETLTSTLAYEKISEDYYLKRSNGKMQRTWSDTAFKTLINSPRPFMKDYLKQRGLDKH